VQPSAPREIPNSGSVTPDLGAEVGAGFVWGRLSDDSTLRLSSGQVSALRRLAKPMSDRVAGRTSQKPAMLDSGAEVSASTTSSEPESGARSVSSIVRQWNRKINNFLGDPSTSVNGARPVRSGQWWHCRAG